ncbi:MULTISPECIES: hypothetical protein [Bacillus cereus group]|uniref:hypothetical protein n=1 Tax=Bacillus cereus group TaxID=86661 RepID=UPI0029C329F5|nr:MULTISPECIES: hypothetical protein [Bacillus cereus group]MDX5808477.1 hypothetical protein [Bacillus cereus group sp. BfR-BA-02730]MED0951588.1 hypothetical protein [Bacillus mobilis]
MENTYWNSNGNHQEELNRINSLKPSWGMTTNKHMNLFITASKVYYDVYNNGGCNLSDCYEEKIREFIIPFADDIKSLRLDVQVKTLIKNFNNKKKLERFMDEVILYLQDKDLNFKILRVFFNYKKEELSKNNKEGFLEISFGLQNEYDGWVNHRVNNWKYTWVE